MQTPAAATDSSTEPAAAQAGSLWDVHLPGDVAGEVPPAPPPAVPPPPTAPPSPPPPTPTPASEPPSASPQTRRAAANQGGQNRHKPMIVVLAALVVVAVVLGGVLWWRLRDSGASSAAQSPATAESQALPAPAPSEPATAPPFIGEWIVENDMSKSGQLPDVGVIRFSADRLRLRGETREVRYIPRGEGRYDMQFTDAQGLRPNTAAVDDVVIASDAVAITISDADHVIYAGQQMRWALVRLDSAAGQAQIAKASALPPLESPQMSDRAPDVVQPQLTAPAPKPVVKAEPSPEPNPIQLAINASLAEGRNCMASRKYDCAISSANAVLRLAPRNRAALAMKREAEAAQARALSEIEIR